MTAATPPLDVKPLPRLGAAPINTAGALASSYTWCEVMQASSSSGHCVLCVVLQLWGMSCKGDPAPSMQYIVYFGGRTPSQIAGVTPLMPSLAGKSEAILVLCTCW